jgi:hypothetical protein
MQKTIFLSLTMGIVCGIAAYPQNITIVNTSGSDQEAYAEVSHGTSEEKHSVRNDSIRSFGLNEYTGIRMQGSRPEGVKGVGIKDSLKFDKDFTGQIILLFDETHNLKIISETQLREFFTPSSAVQNPHTNNANMPKNTEPNKALK